MNIPIPTNTSTTFIMPKRSPKKQKKLDEHTPATNSGSNPFFNKATASTSRVATIIANTIMPPLKVSNEDLSPEDREAREKGLQLAAYIERLCQKDEDFQRWIQEGISDFEAGRTVIFSEDGWKED